MIISKKEKDALVGGMMGNPAHSLRNAGIYAPDSVHNKLGFSKAGFGNPTLLPGFSHPFRQHSNIKYKKINPLSNLYFSIR